MTDKEFEHSELRVSSTNSNLSLSMSSSFTLTLPAMPAESLTATDISFLSRTGQLWISKANYCRFEIISSIEGADLDGRIVQKCINSVVECPLWAELGLSLRFELDKSIHITPTSTRICMVINYDDPSWKSLLPEDSPCAMFKKLSCIFKIRTRTLKKDAEALRKRPRQRTCYNLRNNVTSSRTESASQPGVSRCTAEWSDATQRSCICCDWKPSVLSLGPYLEYANPALENQARGGTTQEVPWFPTPPWLVSDGIQDTGDRGAEISSLVSLALHRLIGIRKTIPGIRTKWDLTAPSLVDIAPAVWNLRHLQSLTSHMELIPSISSSLAGLAEARSSAIRRQLQHLLIGSDAGDEEGRLYTSLYKRLSVLVHMGLQVEPVLKAKNKKSSSSTDSVDAGLATSPMISWHEPPDLCQRSSTDSEDQGISSGIFEDDVTGTALHDPGPLCHPTADQNSVLLDTLLLAPSGDLEIAIDTASREGMVTDEDDASIADGDSEHDYEDVYTIVPAEDPIEDGEYGRGEIWPFTGAPENPLQDPLDWGDLSSYSFSAHGGRSRNGTQLSADDIHGFNASWVKL